MNTSGTQNSDCRRRAALHEAHQYASGFEPRQGLWTWRTRALEGFSDDRVHDDLCLVARPLHGGAGRVEEEAWGQCSQAVAQARAQGDAVLELQALLAEVLRADTPWASLSVFLH